jgi:hypothetical protein
MKFTRVRKTVTVDLEGEFAYYEVELQPDGTVTMRDVTDSSFQGVFITGIPLGQLRAALEFLQQEAEAGQDAELSDWEREVVNAS